MIEGNDGAGFSSRMKKCFSAHAFPQLRICLRLSSAIPSTPCRDWTRAPGAAWSRCPE